MAKLVANLLTALGRLELVELIDLCRQPPGPAQAHVRASLQETFAAQPLPQWEAFLQPLDVCWAPVRSLKEALETVQVHERGMRQEVTQSGFGGGKVTQLGIPIRYQDEPGCINPEIPELGEHTHEVLGGLGMASEDIALASGLAPGQTLTAQAHG